MTDEHMGTCIYDKGRFELRETDNAIIDLKGDFPPIMIASNTVDDGSEPNCADTRSVLHLLNELYHEQKDEIKQLKSDNQELKQDNDIKFWKHECIKEANANSVLLFELGKAINGGYEVSDKFKDFMNDLNKIY